MSVFDPASDYKYDFRCWRQIMRVRNFHRIVKHALAIRL